MHHRDIVEHYLTEEEAEHFAEWAIGKDFREKERRQWPEFWNVLHGNELKLEESGYPEEDIPKMIELWKKRS